MQGFWQQIHPIHLASHPLLPSPHPLSFPLLIPSPFLPSSLPPCPPPFHSQSSPVYGLVVLLHSSVEVDREDPELSHSFHISFEHDSSVYFLAAESAQDMAEWMLAIKSVGWVGRI